MANDEISEANGARHLSICLLVEDGGDIVGKLREHHFFTNLSPEIFVRQVDYLAAKMHKREAALLRRGAAPDDPDDESGELAATAADAS